MRFEPFCELKNIVWLRAMDFYGIACCVTHFKVLFSIKLQFQFPEMPSETLVSQDHWYMLVPPNKLYNASFMPHYFIIWK